jgi:hypothetical protein
MTSGPQIKAARALLGWSVRDLARRAAIEISDVQDAEDASRPKERHVTSIRVALEDAGIALFVHGGALRRLGRHRAVG